jgi:hypothetical protein
MLSHPTEENSEDSRVPGVLSVLRPPSLCNCKRDWARYPFHDETRPGRATSPHSNWFEVVTACASRGSRIGRRPLLQKSHAVSKVKAAGVQKDERARAQEEAAYKSERCILPGVRVKRNCQPALK